MFIFVKFLEFLKFLKFQKYIEKVKKNKEDVYIKNFIPQIIEMHKLYAVVKN